MSSVSASPQNPPGWYAKVSLTNPQSIRAIRLLQLEGVQEDTSDLRCQVQTVSITDPKACQICGAVVHLGNPRRFNDGPDFTLKPGPLENGRASVIQNGEFQLPITVQRSCHLAQNWCPVPSVGRCDIHKSGRPG
jgi:hypothetical protein